MVHFAETFTGYTVSLSVREAVFAFDAAGTGLGVEEFVRGCGGADKEAAVGFIEGVEEGDEATGLVLLEEG